MTLHPKRFISGLYKSYETDLDATRLQEDTPTVPIFSGEHAPGPPSLVRGAFGTLGPSTSKYLPTPICVYTKDAGVQTASLHTQSRQPYSKLTDDQGYSFATSSATEN